jgi:hypothetical protein
MAEGQSPSAQGLPTWGHVAKFDGDVLALLGIGDFITQVSSLLETVVSIGTAIQTILDWVSTFLVDLTNPIRPILQGLIAYISALISDLRKAGLYVTFSDYLLNAYKLERAPAKEDLKFGGYPTALAELTNKLLDVNDPSRPSFSAATSSYNMVFFTGGGVNGLNSILEVISQFAKLFSASNFSGLVNPPIIVSVSSDETDLTIEYTLEAKNDVFNIPPSQFAFVVSTRLESYPLYFRDEFNNETPLLTKEGVHLDTRYLPFISDASKLFVLAPTEISAQSFKEDYFLVYEEVGTLQKYVGTLNFETDIKYESLPKAVFDLTANSRTPQQSLYYISGLSLITSNPFKITLPSALTKSFVLNESVPSFGQPFSHTKYDSVQKQYLEAVKESLYIYLVFRLQFEGDNATINQEVDINSLRKIKDIFAFRDEIKSVVSSLVRRFSRRGVLTSAYISQNLRKDIDLVLSQEFLYSSSFEGGSSEKNNVGLFPIGGGGEDSAVPLSATLPNEPLIISKEGVSPVGISTYVGVPKNQAVLESALRILSVLPKRKDSSGTGNWIFLRLLSDGLPWLETGLEAIRTSLVFIEEGMRGIVDALLAFIEVLKERIKKLQDLILLIKSIIDRLTSFKIPANVSTLGFEARGVTDIASKLTSALDPPAVSGSESVGFYLAFVIGGAPSLLIDIFKSLAGSSEP